MKILKSLSWLMLVLIASCTVDCDINYAVDLQLPDASVEDYISIDSGFEED